MSLLVKHDSQTARGGNMIKGKCSNCGTWYGGWALHYTRYQVCIACGALLEIAEEPDITPNDNVPYRTSQYFIKEAD